MTREKRFKLHECNTAANIQTIDDALWCEGKLNRSLIKLKIFLSIFDEQIPTRKISN